MDNNQRILPAKGMTVFILVLLNTIIISTAYTVNHNWYWLLCIAIPFLIIAIRNKRQKKHAMIRNNHLQNLPPVRGR